MTEFSDLHCQLDELGEQITVLKAERDSFKRERDDLIEAGEKLALGFEEAMRLMSERVKLAYVSGWMAGRMVDERVQLNQSVSEDAAMFMDSLASFRRWEDDQRKKKRSGT